MKILLAFAVALASFTGCTTRPDVGRIRIEVFDNLRQFKLVNETGRDLHNVKVGAWIYTGRKMIPAPSKRVGDWPSGGEFPGQYRFTYGLQKLDVDGTCDEGKFRSIWVEGIEPVQEKPETKPATPRETIVFTLKGQPPNWTVENNSSVTVHKVKAICAFRGSSGIWSDKTIDLKDLSPGQAKTIALEQDVDLLSIMLRSESGEFGLEWRR